MSKLIFLSNFGMFDINTAINILELLEQPSAAKILKDRGVDSFFCQHD